MADADLSIETSSYAGARVLALAGRLTPDACEVLRAAVTSELDDGAVSVVVDLAGVETLTSCGVGTLVWIEQDCRRRQRRLAVVAPDSQFRRTLKLMGLDKGMVVAASVEAAMRREGAAGASDEADARESRKGRGRPGSGRNPLPRG
jgi:anti-anti-sigma factor